MRKALLQILSYRFRVVQPTRFSIWFFKFNAPYFDSTAAFEQFTPCTDNNLIPTEGFIPRLVQEMERTPSGCFTVVEIEHTTKPFAAMNRIID